MQRQALGRAKCAPKTAARPASAGATTWYNRMLGAAAAAGTPDTCPGPPELEGCSCAAARLLPVLLRRLASMFEAVGLSGWCRCLLVSVAGL